jgi:hypothetical protein
VALFTVADVREDLLFPYSGRHSILPSTEAEDKRFFRNDVYYLPDFTTSRPRAGISMSLLWESEIL